MFSVTPPMSSSITPGSDVYDEARVHELFEEALQERGRLIPINTELQNKIAMFFSDKKEEPSDLVLGEQLADIETRYHKCLYEIDQCREELQSVQKTFDQQAMESKSRLDEKESKAKEIGETFQLFKREVARSAENARTGKLISERVIAQFEETEERKAQEVENVRLRNISLQHRVKRLEQQLRQKEELTDKLHLIDFEQLKIENQTLNEKIEERNEELMKLRKKSTTTVQVLSHMREKLQFVQNESQDLKRSLAQLEEQVTQHRDILARTKKERDVLRNEDQRMSQQSGLTGNDMLLEDYQRRKRRIRDLTDELNGLQNRFDELEGEGRGLNET